MLNNDQIQNILLFPLRDKTAQKNFLIASLVGLAGLFIPILPWLALYGYAARIMRQIINEKQEPTMPEWSNWNELLSDGLRLFAIRMVITIPILLILMVGIVVTIIPTLLMIESDQDASGMFTLLSIVINLIWIAFAIFLMIITVPLSVMVGAAEGHIISQDSLAAAFRIKEWWPIFRKNMGGFIIGYLIISAISVVASMVLQVLMYTVILVCLLPLILGPYSAYLTLIMYAFFAQAYTQGRDALQPTPAA